MTKVSEKLTSTLDKVEFSSEAINATQNLDTIIKEFTQATNSLDETISKIDTKLTNRVDITFNKIDK